MGGGAVNVDWEAVRQGMVQHYTSTTLVDLVTELTKEIGARSAELASVSAELVRRERARIRGEALEQYDRVRSAVLLKTRPPFSENEVQEYLRRLHLPLARMEGVAEAIRDAEDLSTLGVATALWAEEGV